MTSPTCKLFDAPWDSAAKILENREGKFQDLVNCRRRIRLLLTKENKLQPRLHPDTWKRVTQATKFALRRQSVDKRDIAQTILLAVESTLDVRSKDDATLARARRFFESLGAS